MLEAIQIEWMHELHKIRTPLLDLFFKGLNFFDTPNFYALLIPAIWFGKNWKLGVRFFSISLLSFFCINVLKELFLEPRPFILDPTLSLIRVGGYSFPSGGATGAILLSALLIYHIRKPLAWMIAIPYFFLISLSRVYLGVHYPIDVLGGWVLGFILFLFYVYAFPRIEKWFSNQSMFKKVAVSQLFPALLLVFSPKLYSAFIAMGMFLAVFVCYFFKVLPKQRKTSALHVIEGSIGVVVSFSLHMLAKQFLISPPIIFLIGFFVVIISSYLCYKVEQLTKK